MIQKSDHSLSQQAKRKLQEIIEKYDPINNSFLRSMKNEKDVSAKNNRLPIPGTVITKKYKGAKHEIRVLENGFEYQDKTYTSLTAVAEKITGAHWNGYLFFNL